MEALAKPSADEINQIRGIGEAIAAAVAGFFAEPKNRRLIDRLEQLGLNMTEPVATEGRGPLAGQTYVITGTLPTLSRARATEVIEAAGGHVTDGVSKQTAAVVAGADAGPWLPGEAGVARPEDLDAAQLNDVLSAFFQAAGWGAVTVAALGPALAVDSRDWAEAEPGTTETPMCFFTSGMLADFLGRLSGETVAVMEVECRSRNDPRCRFLSAAPETLNLVYDQMMRGRGYEEVLGGR